MQSDCPKEKPKCAKEKPKHTSKKVCNHLEPMPQPKIKLSKEIQKESKKTYVTVVGQGVAPLHSCSPAQAHAFAKRAAIADAYRLIAERLKGVRIHGHDTIKNMMVQNSSIRAEVEATVKNASIVDSSYTNGLCEVKMEIVVLHDNFISVL